VQGRPWCPDATPIGAASGPGADRWVSMPNGAHPSFSRGRSVIEPGPTPALWRSAPSSPWRPRAATTDYTAAAQSDPSPLGPSVPVGGTWVGRPRVVRPCQVFGPARAATLRHAGAWIAGHPNTERCSPRARAGVGLLSNFTRCRRCDDPRRPHTSGVVPRAGTPPRLRDRIILARCNGHGHCAT
jgi:hypothetical protein